MRLTRDRSECPLAGVDAASAAPDIAATIDPNLRFEDASFAELLAYWNGKRGGRPLPSRDDVDPAELREHLGKLCLIEVQQEPLRFRFRLVGSEITLALGRDVTGRWFEEVYPPEILPSLSACKAWVVENRRPARVFGQIRDPELRHWRYETVELPLADHAGAIDMVLTKLTVRRIDVC